ncbi:MAG: hypothetical protein LUG25_04775, partial [Oscillospiraceae bacterium]|nr:hypothetical protein [Oscillospiraceae bacterium]
MHDPKAVQVRDRIFLPVVRIELNGLPSLFVNTRLHHAQACILVYRGVIPSHCSIAVQIRAFRAVTRFFGNARFPKCVISTVSDFSTERSILAFLFKLVFTIWTVKIRNGSIIGELCDSGHPHTGQYICADVHDSVRTRAICDLLLYLPAKLRSSDVSIFSILLLPFAAFFRRPISKQAQPDCFFSSATHLLSLTYKHHYSRQARKKQWANYESV